MASRLNCAAKTDVGLKRTNNEDNLIMVPGEGLYVLADGMGGHASGQVASTMCVSHVAKFICEMSRQPDFELPYSKDPKLSPEANLLVNAIKYANERIYIQSCKDRSMEGMGTTVTAIYNAPHGLILAHVGDSRIYRIRKGQITQMSRDHSLLNHLIDTGELKPEDAKNFPQKNIILRAIGLKETVDVDVKEVPREDGDVYLMCSDGLSDLVDAPVIAQTVTKSPNLTEACNQLIGLALKAGGKDNVTVVCVGVDGKDDVQTKPISSTNNPKNVVTTVPNIPPKPSTHSRQPSTSYANEPDPEMIPPRPGHAAMVPPPKGRSSVSNQQAAVSASSAPLRMHSVREIVQSPKTPASASAPRQAVSRNSVSNMPAIPSMGKIKAVQNDQETTPQTQQVSNNISTVTQTSSKDSLPKASRSNLPPVKTTPLPAPSKQPLPKPSGASKLPSISKLPPVSATPTQVKNKSSEDISKIPTLPEAKLIFTQPPVIAGGDDQDQKTTILPSLAHFPPPPEFVPEYVDESDDLEDDGSKTMLECPVLDTSNIPNSAFPGNKSIPRLPKVSSGNSSKPSNPSISRIKTQPSAVLPAIPPSPSSVMPTVPSSVLPAIPPSPSSVMPAVSPEAQSIKPIAAAPHTNRPSPSIPTIPGIKPPVYLNTPSNRAIPDVLNDTPTLENAPDYQTATQMLSQAQKLPPTPNKRNALNEADNGYGNPHNKKW